MDGPEVIRHRTYDDDEDDEYEMNLPPPPPKPDNNFDTVVVVDNLPVVTEEKFSKLLAVVTKIYGQVGKIVELEIPKHEQTKSTLGFAFVEFSTPQEAKAAIERTNGYKLDKAHVFTVNLYTDFRRVCSVSEEYKKPSLPEHKEPENLREWMMDIRGLSQFVCRFADDTEIFWNEVARTKLDPVLKRKNFTDSIVQWSPHGSYLATFHNQGIILWGGNSWNKVIRFQHPGVKLIEFSPREKYLVTYSPQFQLDDNTDDPQCILVWDVRTGKKVKGFSGPSHRVDSSNTNISWLQWSYDDRFLARIGEKSILVYQTPDMSLVDLKSNLIQGVKDFCWSPTNHYIACWVPESGNQAARVLVLDIPSGKEKRQQNFFNVADCKLHWQSNGDFLCVQVECQVKTKKSTYLDVFRIREKEIPDEVIQLKDISVIQFAWEPKGTKFAILTDAQRPDVSFYHIDGKKLEHLKTLEKKAVSKLSWSPQGQFIVLGGFKQFNGVLEFFNTQEMETMSIQEHFMATDVDWDPTGRFVATYVCHWKTQIEKRLQHLDVPRSIDSPHHERKILPIYLETQTSSTAFC
eukprot:TRINITY_DN5604_c0_g2_i5.p1 TRINITY_DN5604_c0_g2~~TRINITY_DN5604_c0_g2_i5.p1  ORF type:complete len:575 (-),score=99.34 TRINITY_DN5604_c0_g2_i5:401-2125(-)